LNKQLFVLLIFLPQLLTAQDKIVIGTGSPFIEQESAATIFYHKQFQFELLSRFENELYDVELLQTDNNIEYSDHVREMKRQVLDSGYDYLLYSHVYLLDDYIAFSLELVNPYTDIIQKSWVFNEKRGFTINESLSQNTTIILNDIYNLDLKKIKNKVTVEKIEEPDDPLEEVKENYKHELFLMNGFLKNHPGIMSVLSWYTGYSFSPYDFLRLEAGFFAGAGFQVDQFNFDSFAVNQPYIGGYAGLFIYFKGIFEPTIGVRLEFSYIFNEEAYLSLPVDVGFRIYLNPRNALRIGSSFQFTTFSFNALEWKNRFTIGVLFGYARKL
jgi:hypothetical protein